MCAAEERWPQAEPGPGPGPGPGRDSAVQDLPEEHDPGLHQRDPARWPPGSETERQTKGSISGPSSRCAHPGAQNEPEGAAFCLSQLSRTQISHASPRLREPPGGAPLRCPQLPRPQTTGEPGAQGFPLRICCGPVPLTGVCRGPVPGLLGCRTGIQGGRQGSWEESRTYSLSVRLSLILQGWVIPSLTQPDKCLQSGLLLNTLF